MFHERFKLFFCCCSVRRTDQKSGFRAAQKVVFERSQKWFSSDPKSGSVSGPKSGFQVGSRRSFQRVSANVVANVTKIPFLKCEFEVWALFWSLVVVTLSLCSSDRTTMFTTKFRGFCCCWARFRCCWSNFWSVGQQIDKFVGNVFWTTQKQCFNIKFICVPTTTTLPTTTTKKHTMCCCAPQQQEEKR